jgi:hypothetical protein
VLVHLNTQYCWRIDPDTDLEPILTKNISIAVEPGIAEAMKAKEIWMEVNDLHIIDENDTHVVYSTVLAIPRRKPFASGPRTRDCPDCKALLEIVGTTFPDTEIKFLKHRG